MADSHTAQNLSLPPTDHPQAEKGSKEPKEPKEGKGSRPPDVGLASGGGASGPSVNDFISKTKTRQKQGLKPSGPELIASLRGSREGCDI